MGRERVKMKMKGRRRDSTKKVRPPCNFCEFSSSRYGCSSEEMLHEQDNEAVLRKQVQRLRLLIRRMTGKEDGVSFTELVALESHLIDVRRIVLDQKDKIKLEEDEKLRKHSQMQEKEAEDGGTRGGVLVPCKFSTSSSEEGQEKQDDGAPLLRMQREFERRNAESLQSEFERLWLLNERMNGRELEGMTSFDLGLLHLQILRALLALNDQKSGPRMEQFARQGKEFVCHNDKESISRLAEQERCSLDNDEEDDYSLQFRLLFVSRKLRKFHNRYHRKSIDPVPESSDFRLT